MVLITTLVKRLQETVAGIEEGGARFLLELPLFDKFYTSKNELDTKLRLFSSSWGIFYPPPSPPPNVNQEPDESGNNLAASLSLQAVPGLAGEQHFEGDKRVTTNVITRKKNTTIEERNINKICRASLRTTSR